MASWVAAGQPLHLFWNATPREMAAAIRGEEDRLAARRDIAVVGGWIAAVESRAKDIHKLDELLAMFRPKKPSPPQSIEEMRRSWKSWVRVTGGTFANGEKTETLQ